MTDKKALFISSVSSAVYQVVYMLTQYIARHYCIIYIGAELLGVDNTILSFINILSLAEAGFSTAIIVYLVVPMKEHLFEEVNVYINTFRVIYKYIGTLYIFLAFFGVWIIPFVIRDVDISSTIYICYFLNAMNGALTYFLAYRKVLLLADQKLYIKNVFESFYCILFLALQIFCIVTTSSYILYVFIKVLQTLANNITSYIICGRTYHYLEKQPLNQKTFNRLIPDVKNLLWGNIAGYIYNASDTIVISSLVGTVSVTYYNNYYMVFYGIKTLALTFFNALTPYVVKLINSSVDVSEQDRQFNLFTHLAFNLWVMSTIPCLVVINDVIKLWVGKEYILSLGIAIMMALDGFICLLQGPTGNWLIASQGFKISKQADMLGALTNIVISILLVKYMGMGGVLLGTLVSRIMQWIFRAEYILRYILSADRKQRRHYWGKKVYMLFISASIFICTYFFVNRIHLESTALLIFVKGMLSLGITAVGVCILCSQFPEQKKVNKLLLSVMFRFGR